MAIDDIEPGDSFQTRMRKAKAEQQPERPKPTHLSVVKPIVNMDDPRDAKWARTALQAEVDRVLASQVDVNRNDSLNIAGFSAYQIALGGYYTKDQVTDALTDAARARGLSDNEIATCLASAWLGAERKGPRYRPTDDDKPQVTEFEYTPPEGGATVVSEPVEAEFDWGPVEPGGTYVFSQPEEIPALWGKGQLVAWARGEALMIAGNQGLGKTTIAGQLVRAQLFGGEVLDLPVEPVRRILYLAMDRPRQIARSLRRQFDQAHIGDMNERFLLRPGPPLMHMLEIPDMLTRMCEHYDADVVYLDSLKDFVLDPADGVMAAKHNRVRQHVIAAGIDICELHHNVKRGAEGRAISTTADVYGSTWLTSGTGSVIMLTGEPGDPIVGFRHLKQPAEEIGPYQLLHDQAVGELTIHHAADLLALAAAAGAEGLSAKGAAVNMFDTEKPSRGEVEKARRKLVKLAESGLLIETEGRPGVMGSAGVPALWFVA